LFKEVTATDYQDMTAAFDQKVLQILGDLSHPYSDLMQDTFCTNLRGPGALQARNRHALTTISRELKRVYEKSVVVLIDEYDAPMHSALEHDCAAHVCSFYSPSLQLPHVISGQRVLCWSIQFITKGLSMPMSETLQLICFDRIMRQCIQV
jgi:hypothetical protein